MTTSEPRISVVVPTYNRCAAVRRLLRAFEHQTLPVTDFEVIVIMDGSEDGTRESLASLTAPFRLHTHWQPNAGRAAACNAGIRRAAGDIVLLLDDDMEPAPGLLDAHVRAHAAGEALGVLGAVPIPVHEASPPVVKFVAAKFNTHLDRLSGGAEIRFRSFYSGNFSIGRDLITDVGLFDEAFRIYGNEDTELSLRLLRAGVRLLYDPEALAYQHYEKDFAGLARDNFAKGRTAVLAVSKHPDEFGVVDLRTFRLHTGKWANPSRVWRLLRGMLLASSGVLPFVPGLLVRFVGSAERRASPRLEAYYRFATELFFWLGVKSVPLRFEPASTGGDGKSEGTGASPTSVGSADESRGWTRRSAGGGV
jgi:GT2 family glycosyltransferase